MAVIEISHWEAEEANPNDITQQLIAENRIHSLDCIKLHPEAANTVPMFGGYDLRVYEFNHNGTKVFAVYIEDGRSGTTQEFLDKFKVFTTEPEARQELGELYVNWLDLMQSRGIICNEENDGDTPFLENRLGDSDEEGGPFGQTQKEPQVDPSQPTDDSPQGRFRTSKERSAAKQQVDTDEENRINQEEYDAESANWMDKPQNG